jgi:hypothetical protein
MIKLTIKYSSQPEEGRKTAARRVKGTQHLAFIGSCMTNLLSGDGERDVGVAEP